MNRTESGKACQSWTTSIFKKFFNYTGRQFADRFIPGAVCRNPDISSKNKTSPWCFTDINTLKDEKCYLSEGDCPDGRFSPNCLKECHCQNLEPCDKQTGKCKQCYDGWIGTACQIKCNASKYGPDCKETCGECKDNLCNHETGKCLNGCNAGWKGDLCKTNCSSKEYGENCALSCGKCRGDLDCDIFTGKCPEGCIDGYNGTLCVDKCNAFWFGKGCSEQCGACKNKSPCHHEDGSCLEGCEPGWIKPNCSQSCMDGWFGQNCSSECGSCMDDGICNKVTGYCSGECQNGFTGELCKSAIFVQEETSSAGVHAAVASVVVILVIFILIIVFILWRRGKFRHTLQLNATKDSDDTIAQEKEEVLRTKETDQLIQDKEDPSESLDNGYDISKEPIYANVNTKKQSCPIQVQDLFEYIRKNKMNDCTEFKKEFGELPLGVLALYEAARKPENRPKNRYGNIIAYDHSRVVLTPISSEPNSDYINANYLDGYKRKNAYIASQGPMKVMFRDFWRMIWQKQCCKIVMLTNLMEACKTKCEQYWPDKGSTSYGNVSVEIIQTTVYTDFTIRTFKISCNGQSRDIKQFHFTSWSDHGTLTSSTPLLCFKHKVDAFNKDSTAPVVVHCSSFLQYAMLAEQSSEGTGSSGGIARSAKRKLNVKSIEDKYQAILEVERASKPKSEIARNFGVPSNTLSTWIKNANKIKEAYQQSSFAPERKRMRTATYENVEHALLKWFTSVRDQNLPISGPMLTTKAEEFAKRLDHPEFKCSNGWLDRFKDRHNITFKKICGEAKSVDVNSEAMNDWKKTLEFKGIDCSGGKRSKERLTVMVCTNMSGSKKVEILVIGKSVNPRCFKNVKTLPTQYEANKKAWMTSEIFINWINKLDKKFLRQQRKVAMIVDNCPAHPHVKGLKSIKLVFLPPNTTKSKVHYRKRVLMKQIACAESKTKFSLTVLDALRFLQRAWFSVTATTISNCFRRAGFSVDIESGVSDQQEEEEDDDDDDIPLARLAGINFTEYANIDNDIPTTEPLTDDDIINEITSSMKETEEDSDEDDTIATEKPVPSLSAMVEMTDTYQSYFEAQDDTEELLPLLAKINNYFTRKQLKRNAGIGRTGTYIGLDYTNEQAKAEGFVDVLKCAQLMRANRTNMIQTWEQYMFLYDALLEAVLAGETTIPVREFESRYQEMCIPKAGFEVSAFDKQFEVAQKLLPNIENTEFKAALDPENIDKNRVKNVLPANRYRPHLYTQVEGSNDYINAVFLPGYTHRDRFIVTQMPLPKTVADFWRMLYDYNSNTVIMLNEFDRNDKTCALYWPEEYGYSVSYDPLSIELLSSSESNKTITERIFKLSNKIKNEDRAVKQFEFNWGEKNIPSSAQALADLLREVDHWTKQSGKGPITVHCMNGASRSGLYCAISLILERKELDQEIDVFQTVKTIRNNRPQFIEDKEQYQYCYKMAECNLRPPPQ
ncbi:Receptor-type tyrosine-protein phosphatase T,Tyrosine-protein phosphatase non-receptor type 22,Receptor-type tyrosine-protein phosphatase kappa,Receptor-type tyrosine-protein phosphatase F,Tyrosine-protein phosphatase 99A,Tyrosine-protein phosphatase Lar,Receptor-type tyrosine-protein phosphatase alpha,Receptor-type tyrosine-protein phosphatase epsilon,Receptor-type tyrosine-protein phosphatase gamma,Receptor-type tyrosine-protein phosphatase N2,Receptor-type tyrosine-protein phosphatase U,Receptor-type ty|uniref:protein-tyrosine-phosphatase n=1 Tax=Mytilus coruscus TaxID=42192 RepID=A0A6J8CW41_MYTCO|nr:Receptor-type tyrosine-protein phosphatase T,Tyrosine-protein phosphatase non-receptor type 22,Receptor-type tyrosine-protein phosphatase kappa,Receptor-type tyrosine-protein phosphatase F,Tyrosine-protein phosphatase 99A,Tyrosine-protein phosphatase Lar,Receptor-type tyrosine-protein phosphatase alpha,Receptor-type tyrosine-protein phosphatase epsilon,Receptor-type tyrosine-protein phosphatase gamma,Receptor-type tyrosine-protein phosphatase N2,Receptor-type tyrosine-protein phosphatase U,Recep